MVEKRIISVGKDKYNFNIYVERRDSVRASILNNAINIRVPLHLSKISRELEIEKLIVWAVKKINSTPSNPLKNKIYVDNGFIKTHSKIYKLQIEIRPSLKNFSKIYDNLIVFKLASHQDDCIRQKYISKQIQKLLAKRHSIELQNHVHRLNKMYFGKEVGKISYKYTISRWGACKISTKEINISTRLLLAPLPVLEYVIIHELAHLIEPNHSKQFWNVVKSVDPNYKQKIKWLKINGKTLKI